MGKFSLNLKNSSEVNNLEKMFEQIKNERQLNETKQNSNDNLESGSHIKICVSQCPYFMRPGKRQAENKGANEGKCKNGKNVEVVYIGLPCIRERQG